MSMRSTRLSRRGFLKTSAAVTGAFAAPCIVPSRAFGANERIVLGHIGVGGQGTGNLNGFAGQKDVSVAAICDVDATRVAKAMKAAQGKGHMPVAFEDYRRLLERDDIDAVVVSTPDHWHALNTIDACAAGKDVFCEKPLTLTILEGRKMVNAAREHGRVVQTGSMQRSSKEFRTACELVRNGRIGKVHTVLVGINTPNHPGAPVPDSEPPAELDYEMWLGPAPERPYNKNRVHYNFRFFRDYSGGQMTNWGAHHLDITQWGLGMDDSGPVKVEGAGTFHPQNWHEVTETCRVTHTYADGTKVLVGQGHKDIPNGTTFIGSEGKIHVNRGKLVVEPEEIAKQPLPDDAVRLYESNDHKRDFLDCIRSRRKPICDVEVGHRSATVCHLGNIAIDLGRPLTWNPETEEFADDDEANERRLTTYRSPWALKS
ncbi:MAG: Gfo/Idh/MocA family oxidoreductase [Planctomycetota bacterium]|nr:Gfo/Idh/MocA family oxidoreductase [Planctomycetota bacterium]